MHLEMLRDEYDLARRYTQSLYADLPEAEVSWRPAPKSRGVGVGDLAHELAAAPDRGILMGVVLIAWRDLYPRTVSGRAWGGAAGVVSGLLGGAIGTPGPPVILYAAAQGWPPRAMKATLQGFFCANQLVSLVSQWWAGLLTPAVAWLALGLAPPAVLGVALGMHLFTAVDHVRLRRVVFAVLFVLGLTLCLRG